MKKLKCLASGHDEEIGEFYIFHLDDGSSAIYKQVGEYFTVLAKPDGRNAPPFEVPSHVREAYIKNKCVDIMKENVHDELCSSYNKEVIQIIRRHRKFKFTITDELFEQVLMLLKGNLIEVVFDAP